MFALGQMYENGYGVEKSLNVAVKWYKWGSEKGSGVCAYNLAFLYENSSMDDAMENAFSLYKQAVESECDEDIKSDAFYALGLLYLDGKGTEQSPVKALECMQGSADLGNAGAQFMTGRMYLEGVGTPASEDLAVKYLRMAAEQGDERAKELLLNL